MAYAFKGTCDSHLRSVTGVDALATYSEADAAAVTRYTVTDGEISVDGLDAEQLRRWVNGHDPFSDEHRGRELTSPDADLILDGTINAPKSYSIAALLHPEVAAAFEALQDRLRDRIITTWQEELNARRGAGGRTREPLHQVEVVELRHRRSRALDPHLHRHLWLNMKVLGEDEKWSNVDSRVAMKLHTLVNAEGELATRTDPEWVGALARHGYSLDADGEIAELSAAVRPLSRRSNQIEANRAHLLLAWRREHPGQEPSPDVLHQIDRRAWATHRPNKPGHVDEDAWEQLIRDELLAIDPALLNARTPVGTAAISLADLDRDLLAARSIVDADKRSTPYGGRFSYFDLRAGATRALAASGVVADRSGLQDVIDDIVERARADTVDLLESEVARPGHVKGFMAASTASLRVELASRFAALTCAGLPSDQGGIRGMASMVLGADVHLEAGQVDAAAAIAGTDRLVSITGPAGAGKTTMLCVARAALTSAGRQLVIVAPTKKAASVAGREVGTSASSLHSLLADHGWRWGWDAAGAESWTRLQRGDADPVTGRVYEGPRRFILHPADRVVVDEAGMVDLHAASALAAIAAETGAGIAMVGDELQAMPVGHAGAMASLTRRATAVVELTAIHRFRDADYAALTLRMRQPVSKDDALAVAADLENRDLIHRVSDGGQARDVMVEAYFRWAGDHKRVALVTSTNEEADAINEAIQQRRLDLGHLCQDRIAIGQGEQRILEGDIVQTRLNDRSTNVENRALWTVRRIRPEGLELASITDSADLRRVTHAYAGDHMHLAYASTVHGIQGETTDASVVGPGVDASGLYVGMTRGRVHNEALAIARNSDAARGTIAETMLRGRIEVGIDDSIQAARTELSRAAHEPDHATGHASQSGASTEVALEQLGEWIDTAREALHRQGVRGAAEAASAHGRTLTPVDRSEGDAQLERLRARLGDAEAQYDILSQAQAAQLFATAPSRREIQESPVDLATSHLARRSEGSSIGI